MKRSEKWDLEHSCQFDHPFILKMKAIDNTIWKYNLLCVPSQMNWLLRRNKLVEHRQQVFEIALNELFQNFSAEEEEQEEQTENESEYKETEYE